MKKGMVPIAIGVLFSIGAGIGIVSVINYANQPQKTFQFWGGSGWTQCDTCMFNTLVLVASVLALIVGVLVGIRGIIKLKNS